MDTTSDFSIARPALFQNALVEQLLLAPPGTNRLSSISGYVSPSALLWCLYQMDLKATPTVELQVVVGMAGIASVTIDDHLAYRRICERYPANVEIRYTPGGRAIHSKVYVWSSQESPRCAYLGSANFTHRGMGIGSQDQENAMCEIDAVNGYKYFQDCWDVSIDCLDPAVERLVPFVYGDAEDVLAEELDETSRRVPATSPSLSRDLYLYSQHKMAPYGPGGGINWGIPSPARPQRPVDEAYLHVTAAIVKESFFPPVNTPFVVYCDDGEILIMRIASGNSGKDITTLPRNDELGRYLRKRMNVPSGTLVGVKELMDYRRGHVTLTRIAEAEYRLDFSQPGSTADVDPELHKLAESSPREMTVAKV